LVLLPFLVQILRWFDEASEKRQQSVLLSLHQSAEFAGVVIDRAFDGVIALVATLASDSELPLRDPGSLSRRLTRLQRFRRDVASLAVWSSEGDIIASAQGSLPLPRALGDQVYFRQLARSEKPALSDLLRASADEDPIVFASAPLENRQAVALAALRLEAISQHLSAVKLRPGQDLFLIDRHGQVAFHTARPDVASTERDVGDHPLVREALAAGSATSAASPGVVGEGVRAVALVKTPVHGWLVGISWSQEEAFGDLRRERRQELAMFSVVSAVSFVGAWALAVYLTARLRRLAAMMDAFTRGELALRPASGRRFTSDEVDDLTLAFEGMARALADERRKRETFVSGIAHELRNVLSPLLLSARMLTRQGDVSSARLYERIIVQIGRVNRLVIDLVDAGRIQRGQFDVSPEPVDLMQIVGHAVEDVQLLAPEHRVNIEGPASLMVMADADRIAQVVANLLGNAVKYGRDGREIEVSVRASARMAEVCIRDQGPGITAEEARSLFEPYARLESTLHQPGIGLGLFISRAIVEAHGGSLRVESQGRGTGTAFCFTVPLSLPTAAS
jgi:signal transduction histidine kinase